jgi:hypothetical protein
LCVCRSGCKTTTSFSNWQELFEVFFENFYFRFLLLFLAVFQRSLRVLRGAKVTISFISHKLFLIFFENKFSFRFWLLVNILKNLVAVAGAKVDSLSVLTMPFYVYFTLILHLSFNPLIYRNLQYSLFEDSWIFHRRFWWFHRFWTVLRV